MVQHTVSADERDQPLVHQFIRLFGRVPTPAELDRYQRSRADAARRLSSRVRQRAAQLIHRL
jgi:hypothetical protein